MGLHLNWVGTGGQKLEHVAIAFENENLLFDEFEIAEKDK